MAIDRVLVHRVLTVVALFSRNYLVLVLLVHVIVIDDLNFNLRLALGHFELHG